MYQEKRIAVIIAAAGSGTRMGSGISKQFVRIGDEMVLVKTLRVFERHPLVDDIYLVVRKEDMEFCRDALLAKARLVKLRAVISGGRERQESVYHGLRAMEKLRERWPADLILVHDGARPFLPPDALTRLVKAAGEHHAAALAVPVKDTIKQGGDGWFRETLDRSTLFAVQTPQGFSREILLAAHEAARREKRTATDDAALVEALGKKVCIVEGSYDNIKITTAEDLPKETPGEWRTGIGYDVHRFQEGRPLILGGEAVFHDRGLAGHSDADVLTHAVMDALLGAAGMGDIGRWFPDTDERYKGISSIKLLARVREMLWEAGFRVAHVDAVLIGEQPKIAPYAAAIAARLGEALGIEADRVNIKGTTTEGLGFAGRKEGLAAQASATLWRTQTPSKDKRRNKAE